MDSKNQDVKDLTAALLSQYVKGRNDGLNAVMTFIDEWTNEYKRMPSAEIIKAYLKGSIVEVGINE